MINYIRGDDNMDIEEAIKILNNVKIIGSTNNKDISSESVEKAKKVLIEFALEKLSE